MPWKGTGPNVYYVPPFSPPRPGKANAGSLLEDPRLPLQMLVGLFGEEVKPLIQRLEGELKRAQAGERSELLQLLIGRSAAERFRIADPRGLADPKGASHG
jgi:hypothetical protein